jgi:hypothetical protein
MRIRSRLKKLEKETESLGGVAVIYVLPGESSQEAAKKHFAQHPKDEHAEIRVFYLIPDRLETDSFL